MRSRSLLSPSPCLILSNILNILSVLKTRLLISIVGQF